MRVYELAKQLGMENRDLIPELKRLGIAVASHSSTLEESAVQKALEKLGSKQKTSVKVVSKGAVGETGTHHPAGAKSTVAQAAAAEEVRRRRLRRLDGAGGAGAARRALLLLQRRPAGGPGD